MNIKNKSKWFCRFLLALVLFSLISSPVFTAETASDKNAQQQPDDKGQQQSSGQQSGFRFIVFSDTNPSYGKEVLHPKFPAALKGIPQHNPSFVIHAGDMIGGAKSEYNVAKYDRMWAPFFMAIQAIKEAKIPLFPCPGNHDKGYGQQPAKESYSKNWMANQPGMATNGHYPYYYSFDYSNNHFIILDSSNIKLGSTQIQWLQQDLANAKGKDNMFVIMHVPFMSSGMFHGETADKSALDLLEKSGVKYVFAAHNHIYREHTSGNLKQITVGTAADDKRTEKDNMFVVVDVLGKGNVKIYPAGMSSGFKQTIDSQPIPAAPTGSAPSFDPNAVIGTDCKPGVDGMSSLLSGDGISYESYDYHNGFFHVITIDPNKYDVKVVSAKKATGKGKATLSEIVMNTPGGIAGINAGFFEGSGSPSHPLVEDGELKSGAKSGYTFLDENGKYSVTRSSELLSYGADRIKASIPSAITALGLVFNGNNVACTTGNCNTPAPRSGICITKDGVIKILAAHGMPKGSAMSGGYVSIHTFAEEAIGKQGCIMGVNLDGGGSTSIEYHINGKDITLKGERNAGMCGGRGFPCQRQVGNALVVVPKQAMKGPANIHVAGSSNSGASTPTGAFIAVDDITGMAAADAAKNSSEGNATSNISLAPVAPVQQIDCNCLPGTANTIVTTTPPASSPQTNASINQSNPAKSSPTGKAVDTDKSGSTYDFSGIDKDYQSFGAKRDLSKLSKFDKYIKEASDKFGVPQEFIKGIIMTESNGKTYPAKGGKGPCDGSGYCLCNSAGYCGLMQTGHMDAKCRPSFECDWGNFQKGDEGAKDQIFSGANYIKTLMASNLGPKNSPDYFYWVAVGYNGGPGSSMAIRKFAAQRLGIPPEQVQWKQVTLEDAKRNQEKYFPRIPGKTQEIFYYASKVMSVVQAAAGSTAGTTDTIQQTTTQDCSYGNVFEYVSIGKYYVNPSFSVDVDYSTEDYKHISDAVKELISECGREDSDDLADCIKDEAEGLKSIGGGNLRFYNGPCDYAENMVSDFVEWTDACLKSASDNCVCEIPLEYEYQKKNTDEEVTIGASGSGTIQITGAGQPQSVSGSLTAAKKITTKTAAEMLYAKKTGNNLEFVDSGSGSDCRMDKRTYKFCAETKNMFMVYDEKENKMLLKPIQYKFAVEFPQQAVANP